MSLNIKDPETDRLVRELSRATGENVTVAVRNAVRERIERLPRKGRRSLADDLMAIGKRCAGGEEFDRRTADEILGYDEAGAP